MIRTPPRRCGSVESLKHANGDPYFRARIALADGSRVRVVVPDKYAFAAGGTSGRERAEMYAAAAQEREDERHELLHAKQERAAAVAKAKATAPSETCTKYFERLALFRKELGRRTLKQESFAWYKWIDPHIGKMPIAKVETEDVERVRDLLDDAIALHKRTAGAEGIGAKRARNVWTVVTTTFKAAMQSKRRDLRVREGNPCAGVLATEKGDSRRRTFMYPVEMTTLFASERVPVEWRQLYALAAYLYLRPGELKALLWSDVDFDAGVVHITKAWDELADEVKPPKTRNGIRDVPIHPNLRPLLEHLHATRDKDEPAVVPLMTQRSSFERARTFRAHIKLAGVTRPRLTENTATTMHVGFRSLRDTGITWLALAGVDAAKMQRRAGHDDVSTTMGYVKSAEDINGTLGTPFPPLSSALQRVPEIWPDGRNFGHRGRQIEVSAGKVASPEGFEPSLAT